MKIEVQRSTAYYSRYFLFVTDSLVVLWREETVNGRWGLTCPGLPGSNCSHRLTRISDASSQRSDSLWCASIVACGRGDGARYIRGASSDILQCAVPWDRKFCANCIRFPRICWRRAACLFPYKQMFEWLSYGTADEAAHGGTVACDRRPPVSLTRFPYLQIRMR
jgi:hypothetical protein